MSKRKLLAGDKLQLTPICARCRSSNLTRQEVQVQVNPVRKQSARAATFCPVYH